MLNTRFLLAGLALAAPALPNPAFAVPSTAVTMSGQVATPTADTFTGPTLSTVLAAVGGRYVSNLSSLTVFDATAVP